MKTTFFLDTSLGAFCVCFCVLLFAFPSLLRLYEWHISINILFYFSLHVSTSWHSWYLWYDSKSSNSNNNNNNNNSRLQIYHPLAHRLNRTHTRHIFLSFCICTQSLIPVFLLKNVRKIRNGDKFLKEETELVSSV